MLNRSLALSISADLPATILTRNSGIDQKAPDYSGAFFVFPRCIIGFGSSNMIIKYTGTTQLQSVSVGVSPTVIQAAPKGVDSQCAISIPLHQLGGNLYLLVVPAGGKELDGSTSIDATYMTNYGTLYTSADKLATVNISEQCQLIGMVSSGSFTAYPTRWY